MPLYQHCGKMSPNMTDKENDSNYYQKQFDQAYRPAVGIALFNSENKILVAERVDSHGAWQLPQGGIDEGEDPETALFREMKEEIGTDKAEIIAVMDEWLYYDFPPHILKKFENQYRGQRQMWFALRFTGKDSDINLNTHETPEFRNWKWIEIDKILEYVVHFKRESYERIVKEFSKNLGI